MKSLKYLSSLLVGLAFAACSQYEEPTPIVAVHEPQQGLNADGVSVTIDPSLYDAEAATFIPADLEGYIRIGYPVKIADITIDPATYNPSYSNFSATMELSGASDFAKIETISTKIVDNVITVSAEDLSNAFQSVIGKNPATRKVYGRFAITASQGTGSNTEVANVRLGGNDFYYGPIEFEVTPVDLGIVIEEAYYLVGTANGWSGAAADLIKFSHSDKSAYDDPVFTLTFDVDAETAAAGWWWKIIPQSAIDEATDSFNWDAAYGVATDGDTAAEGVLVNEGAQAGKWDQQGTFQLTINMLDQTYEFKLAYPYLYTPGGGNGWSQTASMLIPTWDYAIYQGFTIADGEFKFSTQPNWGGISYGLGTAPDANGVGELSADGGAGNIAVSEAGLNFVYADIVNMTYKTPVKIETIGVIGAATPAGWDAQTNLTPSDDMLTWTGTVAMTAGEYKFRCNDNWDIALGVDINDLSMQGGAENLVCDEAGTYEITLYLGSLPYHATLVKK